MSVRTNRLSRKQRTGAAFLLLIVGLLLVVAGATFHMVKSEWIVRRGQSQQGRATTMRRAILAAEETVTTSGGPVRLPVDQQHWIVVQSESSDNGVRLVAQWMREGTVIDTMTIIAAD